MKCGPRKHQPVKKKKNPSVSYLGERRAERPDVRQVKKRRKKKGEEGGGWGNPQSLPQMTDTKWQRETGGEKRDKKQGGVSGDKKDQRPADRSNSGVYRR